MFSAEVAERLGYYVYRLIDPRNAETFYVGKGVGNRVFQHAMGAAVDDSSLMLSDKIGRIRAIQLAGFEVGHVIHRHGLDSDTAFQVEAAVMEAYPGLTNIMVGMIPTNMASCTPTSCSAATRRRLRYSSTRSR